MDTLEYDFSTPMMQQYLQLKAQYAECILFFRLGDFYEMFLDDALIGARVLGITLTSRTRGKDGRIPMAGVPYHAVDTYLPKLINAGYKVAICEQVSQPNGKTLVERQVIRIVTPGTVLDEKSLDATSYNYLVCIQKKGRKWALSAVDVSTGELKAQEFDATTDMGATITSIFTKLRPSECLLPPTLYADNNLTQRIKDVHNCALFSHSVWPELDEAEEHLKKQFRVPTLELVGLDRKPLAQVTTSALLHYISDTQQSEVTHIRHLKTLVDPYHLQLDPATIRNLELLHSLRDGSHEKTFYSCINKTCTPMGSRQFRHWILEPLAQVEPIQDRLEAIEYFVEQPILKENIHALLKQITDGERLLSKLSLQAGGPRDLKALQHALEICSEVNTLLKQAPQLPVLLGRLQDGLSDQLAKSIDSIANRIVDEPPFDARQGGVIRPGVSTLLDDLRGLIQDNRAWILEFEKNARQKTGIATLKVKFNQVFGFYIEVSKSNLHAVPPEYERKQTLVNAERFTTPELKEHERAILQAEEKTNEIEFELFRETVQLILEATDIIQPAFESIATLDCLLGLSFVATQPGWTKPTLSTGTELKITQGRHPLVEGLLPGNRFVPNDTVLDSGENQLLIITGPNMAGKSVLMRQVALITLLAHIGSFVPASTAEIGIVDRIFVRSGASDMISSGLSTFMVEMVETAYILSQATSKSLVIMDEIGRGTSTFDGISLAWAIAEYLVSPKSGQPKTLFATHYHELQELASEYPDRIQNYHMSVANDNDTPVFLYTFQRGAAEHSYGVAVAKMAGLPESITTKAEQLLSRFESMQASDQSPFISELRGTDLDSITPIAALTLLQKWKDRYA